MNRFRFLALMVMALTIGLMACERNEQENNPSRPTELHIGVWEKVYERERVTFSNGEVVEDEYECFTPIWVINSDGTMVIYHLETNEPVGDYRIEPRYDYRWRCDSDNLFIITDGGEEKYRITELDASTMTVEIELFDLPAGEGLTVDVYEEYTFERVHE